MVGVAEQVGLAEPFDFASLRTGVIRYRPARRITPFDKLRANSTYCKRFRMGVLASFYLCMEVRVPSSIAAC